MIIALLYEHPTWSDQLIRCFEENGVEITLLHAGDMFDTGQLNMEFDAIVNRVNIMPSSGTPSEVAFQTIHYLNWLELSGIRVINGARAHYVGASKAMQNGIFSKLGLHFANAIAISNADDALIAAARIGYPVIVKPNIGGSGSGIAKYEHSDELQQALDNSSLKLGIDGTGLVQEYIESDGYVYRVEILGDQLFYSIKQKMKEDEYNYCAADGCHVSEDSPEQDSGFHFCTIDAAAAIQRFNPSGNIVSKAISIINEAEADVGGVEFLLNKKTNQPCFYDFNPYSNFVGNGQTLLGFSPEERYVNFVKKLILGNE